MTDRLETRSSWTDTLNEELLMTQLMSDVTTVEDNTEEWYSLIAVIILLLTLLGHSSVGVIANLVPA